MLGTPVKLLVPQGKNSATRDNQQGRTTKVEGLLKQDGRSVVARREFQQQALSPEIMGRVVGTLLGDGCLIRSRGTKRLVGMLIVSHSTRQRAWAEYKRRLLYPLVRGPLRRETYQCATSFVTDPVTYYRFSSWSHPDLYDLWQQTYQDGHKRITKQLLGLLTEEGLAWWFYDDGLLDRRYYRFSTCAFSLEDNKLMRQYLLRRFGIKASVICCHRADGHSYFYLDVASESSPRLTEILQKHPVPCLQHKVVCPSETEHEAPLVGG